MSEKTSFNPSDACVNVTSIQHPALNLAVRSTCFEMVGTYLWVTQLFIQYCTVASLWELYVFAILHFTFLKYKH